MVPSFPAYEHGNGAAAKEPVQLGSVRVCVCMSAFDGLIIWMAGLSAICHTQTLKRLDTSEFRGDMDDLKRRERT